MKIYKHPISIYHLNFLTF